MNCIYKYKGKKYSEEQFKEYFINNKQEFATPIAKNKDVIDSFKRKMEGIDYVFSQSPELASIGSKAQYLQYLSTIFKTSKVKDIVYHSSPDKITSFEKQEEGLGQFFFSQGKDTIWKSLASMEGNAYQLAALINTKNPKKEDFDENDHDGQSYRMRFAPKEGFDAVLIENKETPEDSERVVFEPEQIHILGSKQDIEGFKQFVNKPGVEELFDYNPELAKQRIKAQLERGENRANVSDATIDRHAESYKQMLKDVKNEPLAEFKTDKEINAKYDVELKALENKDLKDNKNLNTIESVINQIKDCKS